jgi:hypothetical protein
MSPMLLLSLGCVRAGFLRRWDAIIFLDVSATMPFLLASQFVAELFEDVLVHGLGKARVREVRAGWQVWRLRILCAISPFVISPPNRMAASSAWGS